MKIPQPPVMGKPAASEKEKGPPGRPENERQDNPDAGESGGQGKEGQSQAEQQQGSGSQASQKPNELSPSEREELAEQWKNRLAAAAQAGRQAGKLSQSMMRWVDGMLAPSLPWRALLARFFAVNQRDDYSWRRPSRRYTAARGPFLIGTTRSHVSVFMTKFKRLGFIEDGPAGLKINNSLLNVVLHD